MTSGTKKKVSHVVTAVKQLKLRQECREFSPIRLQLIYKQPLKIQSRILLCPPTTKFVPLVIPALTVLETSLKKIDCYWVKKKLKIFPELSSMFWLHAMADSTQLFHSRDFIKPTPFSSLRPAFSPSASFIDHSF